MKQAQKKKLTVVQQFGAGIMLGGAVVALILVIFQDRQNDGLTLAALAGVGGLVLFIAGRRRNRTAA